MAGMRYIRLGLLLLTLSTLWPASLIHAAPYYSYNYAYSGDAAPAPAPYLPALHIRGEDLGIGSFLSPEDMHITDDGMIYVLDTGNERIVVIDHAFQLVRVIDSFHDEGEQGRFKQPSGIFVAADGLLYVADTGNSRIVVLTAEGELIRKIEAPQNDVLPANFRYVPIKLVVDTAGRVYVVGKGTFQGILEFDSGGSFKGFTGVNKVVFDWTDLFWKRVMTREQRAQMALFIPVEFNNLALDGDGFLLATTRAFSNEAVKRLNPSGIDVLRRQGYFPPRGDLLAGSRLSPSMLVSVAADRNGLYSVLDITRGRIFTYDRNGNMLYAFGQLGERSGNFRSPVKIVMLQDRIAVLDKGLNLLLVFEPTRYGSAVRDAVIYTDEGNEQAASTAWEETLKLNGNLEIAHIGLGKTRLDAEDYQGAMEHFRAGREVKYYSMALEYYRKDFMWDRFGILALGAGLAAIGLLYAIRLSRRLPEERGAIRLGWYTMFHPFKGFWELKEEKKASLGAAIAILVLLSGFQIIREQYTGFIFKGDLAETVVNPLRVAMFVIVPFLLWVVSNWSLTTLMDGEGKFTDIIIASAYALVPILILQMPLLLLSHVLTVQEGAFYYLLQSIASLWCFMLLFAGMLSVHQYSVGKTVATMLLTLAVIGVLVFLGLLFFSLAQQVIEFGSILWNEITLRLGEGG